MKNDHLIEENALVLFQGDSITDCDRDRNNPHDLGRGYAMMAASWFSALYPERNVKFLNRGIAGDRTKNLVNRWDEDCISLKPGVLSILIGINNTWRRYDSNDPTRADQFEAEYRKLLERIREELDARIILCEPFLLHVSEDVARMREDLDPKIELVRNLAKEYKTILIPLDEIFKEACSRQIPAHWAPDGVHPSLAGHSLIAQTWLKHVGP